MGFASYVKGEPGSMNAAENKNVELDQTMSNDIQNIPLKRWFHVAVVVTEQSTDVYIDGKLVQSDVLSGVARPCNNAPLEVTNDGGFQGWTSNFKYWSHALNPQEAYNIYKEGYGGSSLGNMFNKYRVKVSFLEDNKEEASFEI